MSRIDSFKKVLMDKQQSVFCLQETNLAKPNKIKGEELKKFIVYELLRQKSNGGGLYNGVHKELCPVWIS